MAPAPSSINGSGLSIVFAIAQQLTQPSEKLPAPNDLIVSRELLPRPNSPEKTTKAATLTPPNLFRVRTKPILCFVRLTGNSTCTHVSGRRTIFRPRKRRPNAAHVSRHYGKTQNCHHPESAWADAGTLLIERFSNRESNREKEAPVKTTAKLTRSSRQNAISNTRKLQRNSKNATAPLEFLFRLETNPILCFLGVTRNFN
jgi:hypothetical protein